MSGRKEKKGKAQVDWKWVVGTILGVVGLVLLFSQTRFFDPVWRCIWGPSVEVEAQRRAIVDEVVENVNEAKKTRNVSDLDDHLLCGEQAREWAEGEVEKGGGPFHILDVEHGLTGLGPDMTAVGVSEGMTYTYKIDFGENCIEGWNPTDVPRF